MSTKFVPNPRLKAITEAAMSEAALAGLIMAGATMKLKLSVRGTGRNYTQKSGRVHRASSPGSPPAPNFGRLRASWALDKNGRPDPSGDKSGKPPVPARVTRLKLRPTSVGWRLSSTLHYADIDSGRGKIAARPYIRPTLAIVTPKLGAVMAVAFKRAFKRAFGGGR